MPIGHLQVHFLKILCVLHILYRLSVLRTISKYYSKGFIYVC